MSDIYNFFHFFPFYFCAIAIYLAFIFFIFTEKFESKKLSKISTCAALASSILIIYLAQNKEFYLFLISVCIILISARAIMLNGDQKLLAKFFTTVFTIIFAIGMSAFFSLNKSIADFKSQEKQEDIVTQLNNKALKNYKERKIANLNEKTPRDDKPEIHDILNVFISEYLFLSLLSLSVVGSIISVAYAWLNKEYRRFNDRYVEYTSKYIALCSKKPQSLSDQENITLQINELKHKLFFLLSEEYTMFFQMNIAYSEVKFKYLFQPYFYILNICYAFGLDLYIDSWYKAFENIVKFDPKETKKYGDLFNKLNEISDLTKHREEKNKGLRIGEFETYLIKIEDTLIEEKKLSA